MFIGLSVLLVTHLDFCGICAVFLLIYSDLYERTPVKRHTNQIAELYVSQAPLHTINYRALVQRLERLYSECWKAIHSLTSPWRFSRIQITLSTVS